MSIKLFVSALALLALGLTLASQASSGGQLTLEQAQAVRGAGDVVPAVPVIKKERCTEVFMQLQCNTNNSLANCSGAGAECKTCKPDPAVAAKIWICKPNEEFNCQPLADDAGHAINVGCGEKWTGTCALVVVAPGVSEWFCTPTNNLTARCLKELKNKCN